MKHDTVTRAALPRPPAAAPITPPPRAESGRPTPACARRRTGPPRGPRRPRARARAARRRLPRSPLSRPHTPGRSPGRAAGTGRPARRRAAGRRGSGLGWRRTRHRRRRAARRAWRPSRPVPPPASPAGRPGTRWTSRCGAGCGRASSWSWRGRPGEGGRRVGRAGGRSRPPPVATARGAASPSPAPLPPLPPTLTSASTRASRVGTAPWTATREARWRGSGKKNAGVARGGRDAVDRPPARLPTPRTHLGLELGLGKVEDGAWRKGERRGEGVRRPPMVSRRGRPRGRPAPPSGGPRAQRARGALAAMSVASTAPGIRVKRAAPARARAPLPGTPLSDPHHAATTSTPT